MSTTYDAGVSYRYDIYTIGVTYKLLALTGDKYEYHDDGRIWSVPRRGTRGGWLKPQLAKDDYYIVGLGLAAGGSRSLAIHRMIALAFHGPCPDGMEVRHLDGNKQNNAATNLAYGTHSENMRDRRTHGTDWNLNKTHCKYGHELTDENVYHPPNHPTGRMCRACYRRRAAERKARRG